MRRFAKVLHCVVSSFILSLAGDTNARLNWEDNSMKERIEQELLDLGAPTGRLGYDQMTWALLFLVQENHVTSTTRVLYPRVAEQCNSKPARIERNVREEIKAIWTYGNQRRLDQLFINRGKFPPGNKEFLYTLARHLQHTV